MAGVLKVSVISPEATLFEGDAPSVTAPAFDGEVGILPSHAPMVTTLGAGVLRIGADEVHVAIRPVGFRVGADHTKAYTRLPDVSR